MAVKQWNVGDVLTAADMNSWTVPVAAYKTSTQSVTSSTTLVNDTALVVPVAANVTYRLEMYLNFVGAAIGTGDLKIAWTFPSGLTLSAQPFYIDTAGGTRIAVQQVQTSVLACGTAGAGNNTSMSLRGTVVVSSTAGNLQLQWAQNTSSGTATSVLAGSFLLLQRIS